MDFLRTDYLSMPGVADQRHLRGTFNASYAQLDSTGLADASVTLFNGMINVWRDRTPDTAFTADLDRLQPATLTRLVRERLAGLEEFADPGLIPAMIRAGAASVAAVRARGVSRVVRDAAAAAGQAGQEASHRLRESLGATAAAAPHRVRQLVGPVNQVLQAISFPPPDAESLNRTTWCLNSIDQLNARPSALPAAPREFVAARLTDEARAAHVRAVSALAADLAGDEFRRHLPRLLAYLDELATRATQFGAKLAAIGAALEERRKQAALDRHVPRASVVLAIPGPDERDVLAGMIARAGAADVNGLAELLLERFEARLREQAAALCPHLDAANAPLCELVRGADPGEVAGVFARLAEDSAGPRHTLWEAVERYGVDRAVAFLYRRAEQTVSLTDRDVPQFNIAPQLVTIARLPRPVGQRDAGIRDHAADALRRLDPACLFADGPEDDRVVTLVRARIGWPIGIEASNRSLLDRYLRAVARGHHPHLVLLDFLPDAPLGQVSPSVAELADPRWSGALRSAHPKEDS